MKKLRLFGAALLLSSIAIGPALASPPPYAYWRIYYAEPALVTYVGEKIFECTGSYMQEGVVTPYYDEVYSVPCE